MLRQQTKKFPQTVWIDAIADKRVERASVRLELRIARERERCELERRPTRQTAARVAGREKPQAAQSQILDDGLQAVTLLDVLAVLLTDQRTSDSAGLE